MATPTSDTEQWTLMRLLQVSAKYLGEKGSPSARLDAELLLAHVLDTTRIKLYVDFDKPIQDYERSAYRELIRRRAGGEPVAYLVGSREFYGRPFQVDARVLVPRPETELVVDTVRRLFAADQPWRMADLGTGSGALAVTLAGEFPQGSVDAVELSPDAIAVARENADRNGMTERIVFYEGSWVEPLAGKCFDVVVSNPPYIADEDPEVEPGVRTFEPHEALFPGPTGLEAIEILARDLPSVLAPEGVWVCEFGARQKEDIAALLSRTGWQAEFERDLAGLPRLFIARRNAEGKA